MITVMQRLAKRRVGTCGSNRSAVHASCSGKAPAPTRRDDPNRGLQWLGASRVSINNLCDQKWRECNSQNPDERNRQISKERQSAVQSLRVQNPVCKLAGHPAQGNPQCQSTESEENGDRNASLVGVRSSECAQ